MTPLQAVPSRSEARSHAKQCDHCGRWFVPYSRPEGLQRFCPSSTGRKCRDEWHRLQQGRLTFWAPGDWRRSVFEAIDYCALRMEEFTSDDVRARLESLGVQDPPHPNSWGKCFKEFCDRGRIVYVGFRPSSRPEARGRQVKVWRGRSL